MSERDCASEHHDHAVPAEVTGSFTSPWNSENDQPDVAYCARCAYIAEMSGTFTQHARDLPEAGDRVRCIEMPHDPDPVPPGTEGTVTHVTVFDPPIPASYSEWEPGNLNPIRTQLPAPDTEAEIGVSWDTGSRLSLMVPGDHFEIVRSP